MFDNKKSLKFYQIFPKLSQLSKRIKQGKCAYMLTTYNEFVTGLLYVFNNRGKEKK